MFKNFLKNEQNNTMLFWGPQLQHLGTFGHCSNLPYPPLVILLLHLKIFQRVSLKYKDLTKKSNHNHYHNAKINNYYQYHLIPSKLFTFTQLIWVGIKMRPILCNFLCHMSFSTFGCILSHWLFLVNSNFLGKGCIKEARSSVL